MEARLSGSTSAYTTTRRIPTWLVVLWACWGFSLAGCGGSGDRNGDIFTDVDRDETVGVEVTSSPTGRAVEVSVTGNETVTLKGTTPFSTQVRVHIECALEGTCILGRANFVPLVNDPSSGTLRLCLSALGHKRCATDTIVVFVTLP